MAQLRALLTGRDGFTGHYVEAELEAAGYKVVGLGDGTEAGDAHSSGVNLLDSDAVRAAVAATRPDVVVHLAAISFVAHGDVEEIYRVNVVGTRNLLEALAQSAAPPELVVLASSANVYGNAQVDPITEAATPAPANDYAVSKLAMEHMARLWMDRLPIIFARPFNYTGVGQSSKFLIPKIVEHFCRGDRIIELGNTQVDRDFGDVRDVAGAYASILKAGAVGMTFNICSGIGHSLGDVLDLMANIAGYEIEVQVNPAFLRDNEVKRLVGSNEQLKTVAGWTVRYSLRQTLAWMYQMGSIAPR